MDYPKKNILYIIKGHNFGTIQVKYLKIYIDLHSTNFNVISKFWLNWMLDTKLNIMKKNQKLHIQ